MIAVGPISVEGRYRRTYLTGVAFYQGALTPGGSDGRTTRGLYECDALAVAHDLTGVAAWILRNVWHDEHSRTCRFSLQAKLDD
jgi:hypothetical protein